MSTSSQQIADRIATKLTGEFYVGQRVRRRYLRRDPKTGVISNAVMEGIVRVIHDPDRVGVDFGEDSDGEIIFPYPSTLEPV